MTKRLRAKELRKTYQRLSIKKSPRVAILKVTAEVSVTHFGRCRMFDVVRIKRIRVGCTKVALLKMMREVRKEVDGNKDLKINRWRGLNAHLYHFTDMVGECDLPCPFSISYKEYLTNLNATN